MPPNTGRPLRILVVDDQDFVRRTIELILKADHHIVKTVGSGHEALDELQPGRFDLVITDYNMPGMKGDQLVSGIKALNPSPPVIMLTAYAEAMQPNEALLKNIDFLISKPFSIQALREAVARFLSSQPPPPEPSPT